MNTVQQTKQGGFTIIEVVLVLAIAGLIFLMVFIALPALQRNQRDQQRRDDAARVVGQLQSFATNNRGELPADNEQTFRNFLNGYLRIGEDGFRDPSGDDYGVMVGPTGDPALGVVQYARSADCNGENIQTGAGVRQAAVRLRLESGGFFCQSVQG